MQMGRVAVAGNLVVWQHQIDWNVGDTDRHVVGKCSDMNRLRGKCFAQHKSVAESIDDSGELNALGVTEEYAWAYAITTIRFALAAEGVDRS